MIRSAISASYHRDFEGLMSLRTKLVNMGIEILFPEASKPVNPDDDFIILSTDTNDDARFLQEKNLKLIDKCDFLYVFNPNGYIGLSVSLEIGYAFRCGIPIFSFTEASDVTLSKFVLPAYNNIERYITELKNRKTNNA